MRKMTFKNKNRHNQKLSDNGRRLFVKKAAVAAVTMAGANLYTLTSESCTRADEQKTSFPWYRKVTRWGQTNITEKDPVRYDIDWWRKYWKRTNTGGVIINAGGIVAYYPSKIPLHHAAQSLQGRDLFGDLCRAAHEDGLAVFARMDSNLANEEFYKMHPGWFAVNAEGKPYKGRADLFVTCINSPYYNEHIPSILTEIADLYHPEGFTDNSWKGLGRTTICYCRNCKTGFFEKTGKELPLRPDWNDPVYRNWIRWNYDRKTEIWDLNNRTTKAAGGPDCIWSGMLDSSVSGCNAKEILSKADIVMLDSQCRNDAEGFQRNSVTGKMLHGLLGWDKLIPESMAMYQNGNPVFRVTSKPSPEAQMWMMEGIAGGIQPWWHHIGAYHEDRRMYHTAEPILNWHKANEEYLINREPVATVGVLWSQENQDFFGRNDSRNKVALPFNGFIQAMIRYRIPFLPVHADHIERDSSKFSLLILPDLGSVTKSQVAALRRFVEKGGGLLATGESSLYDEWGDRLEDYSLADIFGVHLEKQKETGPKSVALESSENHTYLRLTPELRLSVDGPHDGSEPEITCERHPVLNGFEETDILPYGGGSLPFVRLDPGAEVLLTFIPEFPRFPPELSWMREPKTNIPGLILNILPGGSRIVFMPADIDRQFALYNLPDHGNLLANLIRWAAKDDIPLSLEGRGLIDCNLYYQPGRMILHLVNLTSDAAWRQPIHEYIPVGPLTVKVRLAENTGSKNIKLLVSDKKITGVVKNGWISFEITSILNHEVALIES